MLTLVISELFKKHLYLLDSEQVNAYDKNRAFPVSLRAQLP